MREKCKVSVIVPMHNAERHLQECLTSIAAQSLREIEVICVDDGSTDGTEAVVREFMAADSRFSLISQENLYAGAARNAGIKKSQGTYLVFWDADDIFEPEALNWMYQKMEAEQADICVCDAVRFRDGSDEQLSDIMYLKHRFIPDKPVFSIKDIPQYIFNFTTDVPWNKMYRRVFVEEQKLEFEHRIRANDHYFVLLAFALAEAITIVDKPLIRYRISNETSLTSQLSSSPLCTYEALLHAKESLAERNVFENELVKQSIANRAVSSLIFGMEKQKDEKGFLEIFQTLKTEGFEKLFVTDLEEEAFYTKGGYRKYCKMMDSGPIEYLLSEYIFIYEQNADLKYQRAMIKKERNKAVRELKYIKERKWYQMIESLIRFKNRILGKNK